eukprot:CAMPEP_0181049346 /NCGR_PEP_ID=MMETSP1070-20121207/15927_1 /TAXON_ID=265543 /ORGANISM="Minutocellus polymorphus, Strain NH13" /LENGTH=1154 /DNA_ID=CAMNT_0023128205 /DNA_START=55 /DNA_END=3519 /DNA_ORIENTATION=-
MATAVLSAAPMGSGPTAARSARSAVATASGLLAMLSEPSPALVSAALTKLLAVVDTLWHEVAESLPDLEAIAEGAAASASSSGAAAEGEDAAVPGLDLPSRRTAAAIASRVYFHLEEPVQALRLALDAGVEHFNPAADRGDPYVECLVGAALEAYVKRGRVAHGAEAAAEAAAGGAAAEGEDDDESAHLDPTKLSSLVDLMFVRCYADGRYAHALGVALEARSLPKVSECLTESGTHGVAEQLTALRYALDAAVGHVSDDRPFRDDVVTILTTHLAGIFASSKTGSAHHSASAVALCVAYQLRNQPHEVGSLLSRLLGGDVEAEVLLGLQLCFDMVDSGDEAFVGAVAAALPTKTTAAAAAAGEEGGEEEAKSETASSDPQSDEAHEAYTAARRILTGGFVTELSLSFLHKNSNSDTLLMEHLQKALDERGNARNSVLHNWGVGTHAVLNAGTTNDSFLRDHLDWMKKAGNWAKFSATASLGVIHAGHTTEAMTLLEPYLPPSAEAEGGAPPAVNTAGGYAEGGSLYALGLIHGSRSGSSAAKRDEAATFLRTHLRHSHANEVISHGAALGVGLTTLGSANLEVVNELKELLYTDSAVAGEAAGMAIGLVLVGSGAGNVHPTLPDGAAADAEEIAEAVAELRNYARETQHEKIIRGLSMGLALIQYGQEENADVAIEEMRSDRDPILRYGAMYSLAMAYCGTGSNKAIRILLHTAVSDVSDDVRMAAVIALAFVLFKTPERVPQLVKLLLESFNPHVRYASCMAVGIAMAGTGDADSVALLEPMLEDMTDFVRQGALIGTAMIYMQQSDSCNRRKIKTFREKLASTISDKHQSTLTKMGAILATGIIDAGGRNCALDLGSRNGFTKMSSAAGLALWLQHWHWYPMMHMFSLALTPTFTIGLNGDFKYPKNFEIQCNSKPSVFAYPKPLQEKKEKEKKRVETVALSTTAKNKARIARKKAKEAGDDGAEAMDVDEKKEETKEGAAEEQKKEDGDKMEVDGEGGEKKPERKKREPEPTSFRISNPSRITKAQAELCAFDLNQRYRPILPEERVSGVIMLTDSTPGEEEELGAVKPPSMEVEGEADPPEPFEWAPPGHDDYREGLPPPPIPEPEDDDEEKDSDDKEDEEGSKPRKREEDHEEDLEGPGLVGGAKESS